MKRLEGGNRALVERRLRQELEGANQSIDEKLGQIEEAGIGIYELTCQVGGGRARIAALEDDVARLSRKDDCRTLSPRKPECRQIIYFICPEVVALL